MPAHPISEVLPDCRPPSTVANIRTVHRHGNGTPLAFQGPPRPRLSAPLRPPPHLRGPRRPAAPRSRSRIQINRYIATMVLDSLSSPHRRSQNTFFVSSAKKPQSSKDDSWSALVERHRFLLTTLVVLAFLCTIYLYFAVTLGASNACAGLAGAERIECQARSVLRHGKLKFL
ncbi:unnamed protein product [Urochloa humidicola]